jgi:pimeloyl-ACP methyl ester carboxylesterase
MPEATMSKRYAETDDDRTSAAGEIREQLLTGMPVTERELTLAGVTTAVLEGGAGPPVVLLHSAGEFAALWAPVIPDLVTTHRVIVPDLPGHGASAVTGGVLTADRVLAWLDELIENTCPSPPTLAGHGLGGAIAARFGAAKADQADRVAALVLVDALGLAPFEPVASFGTAMHRFLEQPTEHTRDDLFEQCFFDLGQVREQLGGRWAAIAAYALDRARSSAQRSALDALMPDFGFPAIASADLARIVVPTTLIWGRHDRQVPLRIAETCSAGYGWPLHIIDSAGDDPVVERPAPFVQALRAALAAASSPAELR